MQGRAINDATRQRILALISRQSAIGGWSLTYREVAKITNVHPRTVSRIARQSAAEWYSHTRPRRIDELL